MTDHSQHREQAHILRYFGDRTGTFLDIGANDGRTFSNTYALALKGWAGVCVDASPRAYQSLCETYKDRPDIQTIHAAITDKDGPIVFHEAMDTLVSSLDESQRKTWSMFDWKAEHVPGMTFATLMGQVEAQRLDMISIDTEGHDLIILAQMDLAALGCDLLCIEHGGEVAEVKALCPGMRELHFNGVNLIMAR